MTIAEAFLGALFNVLLDRLASPELLDFLRPLNSDAQLTKLHRKLRMIGSFLDDAENKRTSDIAVREWLNELEQLAYDIEDLVDKLNTEALQRTLMEETSNSQVQNILSTILDFIPDSGMVTKLTKIDVRLEELFKDVSCLRLEKNVSGRSEKTGQRLQQQSSLVEKSEVHGREKEKEVILNKVLGVESTSTDKISVIPIVGMGGVGKTTLARLVYDDDRLKGDHFDLKAWATVSDEFDVFRVTKIILKEVSPGTYEHDDDLNTHQVKLKETLSKKRFLVVLDDVWNKDYLQWDSLCQPFLAGKPGSKIIVTTRDESVAKIMSNNKSYHLDVLSEEAALSLLARHSLRGKTFDERPDLRENGKYVVRRCKNLPLAVKAIGGLLRTKDNPKEWEDVVNSGTWMAKEEGGILPALRLSYQYLPSELKRCFAYCALFPKDYEFDKFELEILWMAEGFVNKYLGSPNFDELLSRSFFQQSSANSSRFVMHDLHNDLAGFVAGDKCLRMEMDDDEAKESLPGKISERVRHLSIINCHFQDFNFVNQPRGLRTFLPLSYHDNLESFPSQLLDPLPNVEHLRVLSFASCYSIEELPNSVGKLKQLRYLDLANTGLKWLPESLTTLINLKVLILRGCSKLTKLPESMENLFNLCLLDITDSALREMPPGIGELTSLHTLPKVIVGESGGMRLKGLGNLSHLQGEITIRNLENVVNVQEAKDARLIEKQNLDKINLSWWDAEPNYTKVDEILQMNVLNALKPHENLSSLVIDRYGGASLSNWIGDPTFSKLVSIKFYFCIKCTNLPPLGQLPLLRELIISVMDQVKVIGDGFYRNKDHREIPFPSLETLIFAHMRGLEEWLGLGNEVEGVIKLPRLRILDITNCPNLVSLPIHSLPSLRELWISESPSLKMSTALHDSSTTLESLRISGLVNLNLTNLLGSVHSYSRLTSIKLEISDGLESFPDGGLPTPNLRSLEISICRNLKSLPHRMDSLLSLQSLKVDSCPLLIEPFPPGNVPPNLTQLSISACGNLKSLPHRMDLLLSLQSLKVHRCPLLIEPFPQGNVPPNLTQLSISECGNLKSLREWELHKLTSLQLFSFSPNDDDNDDDDDDDDDQHYVLPPSLAQLQLSNLLNLKTLPKGFQNLTTSLRHLQIKNCPKLEALPMVDQLGKLSSLRISGCPLLKQRCSKNKGDYWPIISDIPELRIRH